MANVVFDLGGVLIDWNPRYLYTKLLDDEQAVESFLADICTGEWNERQDAGRSFDEGVRELVALHPNERALIEAYRDRWVEMLGGTIEGTVQVLDELRTSQPVYALTNWSAETFPLARERFDFLGWFRGVVVSGEERVKKPDRRIFEILLERYALNPSETVFIDDREDNVRAAATLGIDGVHFTGSDALREALVSRGLLE